MMSPSSAQKKDPWEHDPWKEEGPECFVVMPFGIKPFNDGTGRTYDFEKVYRIVIQRAIREAGMKPVRADERVGSSLIHTDMFKDLRDRDVVLVDLSLNNPNVFYELGIRHVMSNTGTVLICREGSELPFDVKLSRVVFYKYDGENFDWEEAERVVVAVQSALRVAQNRQPDSPIHALLEMVMRDRNHPAPSTLSAPSTDWVREYRREEDTLKPYEEIVAQHWQEAGKTFKQLSKEHRDTIFGARALGRFCLAASLLREAVEIADYLKDAEQYRLVNEIFAHLYETQKEKLDYHALLVYASAYSEAHQSPEGANHAIALAEEALARVIKTFADPHKSKEASDAFAACYRSIAGLQQWKWLQLTRKAEDLTAALQASQQAIEHLELARENNAIDHIGYLALTHLKSMLFLRIKAHNVERPDTEGHREAVRKLVPTQEEEDQNALGVAYTRWYQTIALADLGLADLLEEMTYLNIANDASLLSQPDLKVKLPRMYVMLRRFLEQYKKYLRNSTLIGRLSQSLQRGQQASWS